MSEQHKHNVSPPDPTGESTVDAGHSRRNSITSTHVGNTALGSPRILPPNREAEQLFLQQIDGARSAIMELPDNTEGLDLDRIESFRKYMGAPKKEAKFLNPDDFDEARIIARQDTDEPMTTDPDGDYLENIDMFIVKRRPEIEALNGPEITESVAIHEAAHSNGSESPIQIRIAKVRTGIFKTEDEALATRTRTGFSVKKTHAEGLQEQGNALEEGYAELERGQYVLSLGLKNGFAKTDGKITPEGEIDIPGHYWYLIPGPENGQPVLTHTRSAIPAATLELLIEQDASLLGIIRESRHSADAHRKLISRMNSMVPGLYQKMRKTDIRTDEGLAEAEQIYKDTQAALSVEIDHDTASAA